MVVICEHMIPENKIYSTLFFIQLTLGCAIKIHKKKGITLVHFGTQTCKTISDFNGNSKEWGSGAARCTLSSNCAAGYPGTQVTVPTQSTKSSLPVPPHQCFARRRRLWVISNTNLSACFSLNYLLFIDFFFFSFLFQGSDIFWSLIQVQSLCSCWSAWLFRDHESQNIRLALKCSFPRSAYRLIKNKNIM